MESLESLYDDLIEQEEEKFPVKEENLQSALDFIHEVYSPNSLHHASTYIEYNNPNNRLAYLKRFGALHAEMTMAYFQQLINQTSVSKILNKKETIEICCLGGGPGNDVAGIFKAWAEKPHMYGKIEKVTILDICGGWRNSFDILMERLTSGSEEGIPKSFVNRDILHTELIQVNLLDDLSDDIEDIIQKADLVTMVKFMSTVIADEDAWEAFKDIADLLQPNAVLLLIDNEFEGKDLQFLRRFCKSCGLQPVLGPIHEIYDHLNVSVVGLIKRG